MDRYDIASNDSGVLRVENNDLIYDISDQQHVQDTINCAPGWWKENFYDGVNIRSFLNSSGQEQILARKIKIELEKDLYRSQPKVNFDSNGKLNIQPNASF